MLSIVWAVVPHGHVGVVQNIQKKLDQPHLPAASTQDKKMAHLNTHPSPQVRKITNLFKNTHVKVTFKSNNSIVQLTKPHIITIPSPSPHNMSGIYSICNTCKQAYIGQTSRILELRYQEHTRYIKNNDPQLSNAQHILYNRHEYGPIDQ
jgi:hypothetical protein